MNRFFRYFLGLCLLCGCPQKPENNAPQKWVQWTKKLKKHHLEKFASPSITSHVYLDKAGDRAFIKEDGPYPRLVLGQCDSCKIMVGRGDSLDVYVTSGDKKNKSTIAAEQPTVVPGFPSYFLSYYVYKNENKIRVFLHDLSQTGLNIKRQRDFFDYDPQWNLKLTLEWLKAPEVVQIQRSDGTSTQNKKVALLRGKKDEVEISLSVYNFEEGESYKSEKQTMLLYRDFSNGKKTYGAGRFLVVDFPKALGEMKSGDVVDVDFNYSYNPPCAVSTGFHCPLAQDMVKTAVEAGEKSISNSGKH